MLYSDLVEKTADEFDLNPPEARQLVEKFFDSIVKILQREGRLELRGFGVFEVREREGHKGRIPGEGVEVDVPPRRVPAFKASKKIKEELREISLEDSGAAGSDD